jgi:cyanophycinase-like exopeptidase
VTRILASCGVPHPSIAYIGAASGDNHPFFLMLSTYMRQCGAGQVTLAPLASKRAKIEKAQAILESADMVFVSGGDVEAGMRVLDERQILPFLRGLFESGKPFFGISAGSIMLARQWVRWADPDDDATAGAFPCMGFAPVLCDTHGEGEGWEELRALLRLTPDGALGYGIPAGAGLCVNPDGRMEALGAPVYCFAHKSGAVMRIEDLLARSPRG